MSDKMDFEWNVDLDTGAKKVTSNNVLVNVHEGNWLAGLSYARLNAPGRAYSDGIPSCRRYVHATEALPNPATVNSLLSRVTK
jgi:hypothetical protein